LLKFFRILRNMSTKQSPSPTQLLLEQKVKLSVPSTTGKISNDSSGDENKNNTPPTLTLKEPSIGAVGLLDKSLTQDVILLIIRFLRDEGYLSSAMILQDESDQKLQQDLNKSQTFNKIFDLILEGKFVDVDALVSKLAYFPEKDNFLYEIYKQQFFELVEEGKLQKSYTFLTKRLKPLENLASLASEEFKDLCYVLSCEAVQQASRFKEWDGAAGESRKNLVEKLKNLLDVRQTYLDNSKIQIPPNRLKTLLQQALEYQVLMSSCYSTARNPSRKIPTLFRDFEPQKTPSQLSISLSKGNMSPIKSITFLGKTDLLCSGSNSGELKIWNTTSGDVLFSFTTDSSRIWKVHCSQNEKFLSTANSDGKLQIWNIEDVNKNEHPHLLRTLQMKNDAYCVDLHPVNNRQLVASGYTSMINLFDVETSLVVRSFKGHHSSVCSCQFSPHGSFIVSGGKDCQVKFWDVQSGSCLQTLSQPLGEVSSVKLNQTGSSLLTSSKDNTNRLWDLKMMTVLQKYKGHQNNHKNFIGCSFASNEKIIIGGSEDSIVYCWDVENGEVVNKLQGHSDIVFDAIWNSKFGIMASCSSDRTVQIWI